MTPEWSIVRNTPLDPFVSNYSVERKGVHRCSHIIHYLSPSLNNFTVYSLSRDDHPPPAHTSTIFPTSTPLVVPSEGPPPYGLV